jgi:hypothetical protein
MDYNIKNNNEMYYACKLINIKSNSNYKTVLKIENHNVLATNGHVLIHFNFPAEDGFYMPIKVTKKEIIIRKINELDFFVYPETDSILNALGYTEVNITDIHKYADRENKFPIFLYDLLNNIKQCINYRYLIGLESILEDYQYKVKVLEKEKLNPYIFNINQTVKIAIMAITY